MVPALQAQPVAKAGLVLQTSFTIEQLEQLADQHLLFAILDACDAPHALEKAQSLGGTCLYGRGKQPGYWPIAPWLVRADVALVRWITTHLWREPWGLFVTSSQPYQKVYRHFHRFQTVHSPTGTRWAFRYFDPRILPPFLRACNGEELRQFFGPLHAYLVGWEDHALSVFSQPEWVQKIALPAWQSAKVFKIRSEHQDAFLMDDQQKFLDFLTAHIRDKFHDTTSDLSPDTLADMIGNGIKRAKRNGFQAAGDITAFVALMFELAPDFDEHPDIRKHLDNQDIPIGKRLETMLDRVHEHVLIQVSFSTNVDAWFEPPPE